MVQSLIPSSVPVTLWWPDGANGEVYVIATLRRGQRLKLALPVRFGRLLHVLFGARETDLNGVDHPAIGWRTRNQLVKAIEELSGVPLSTQTLSRYGSQIVSALAEELARLAPGEAETLQLLERKPLRGMRLAEDLLIERREGPWIDPSQGPDGN